MTFFNTNDSLNLYGSLNVFEAFSFQSLLVPSPKICDVGKSALVSFTESKAVGFKDQLEAAHQVRWKERLELRPWAPDATPCTLRSETYQQVGEMISPSGPKQAHLDNFAM